MYEAKMIKDGKSSETPSLVALDVAIGEGGAACL